MFRDYDFCQNNNKCNTSNNDRRGYRYDLFSLLCGFFRSNTSFFGFASRFQPIGFFFCFYFFDHFPASGYLFVCVFPAGNALKKPNSAIAPVYRAFYLFVVRRGIYSVLAAHLGFIQALLNKRICVLEAGDCFERCRRRFESRLGVCRVHLIDCAIINTGQTGVFVAFIDMGNIAAHFGFEFLITETNHFSVVFSIVKGLGTIRQLLAGSNLQISHQLAEVCLCVLGIYIEDFFTINVSVLPFSVFEKKIRSFQKGSNIRVAAANDNGLLDRCFRFVGYCNLLYSTYQILHEAEFRHILRL